MQYFRMQLPVYVRKKKKVWDMNGRKCNDSFPKHKQVEPGAVLPIIKTYEVSFLEKLKRKKAKLAWPMLKLQFIPIQLSKYIFERSGKN